MTYMALTITDVRFSENAFERCVDIEYMPTIYMQDIILCTLINYNKFNIGIICNIVCKGKDYKINNYYPSTYFLSQFAWHIIILNTINIDEVYNIIL